MLWSCVCLSVTSWYCTKMVQRRITEIICCHHVSVVPNFRMELAIHLQQHMDGAWNMSLWVRAEHANSHDHPDGV